ncbi:MAG TPA: hypothetical protein PLP26_12370 [Ilumatobacteraceae bacterium]|nr:hypothetical protein [Ilumatobacteraceae bacterium]
MNAKPGAALQPVLTSRQADTSAATPALSSEAASLDVAIRHARAIATAGEAIPRAYRDKPGAVLLAREWANARGVDILTAIQTVSFVDGRPVIDATMQRALAQRAGYRVRIEPGDTSATAVVERDGAEVGRATYTLDDAKTAGLLQKKNWQQNPKNMLVARATTQALRWHAPDVMVGVFTDDDDVEVDHVATLSVVTDEPASVAAETPNADDADEVVEAEVVPDIAGETPQPTGRWESREALVVDLKAHGVTQQEAVMAAREIAAQLDLDTVPASVGEIVTAPAEMLERFAAWVDGTTEGDAA